MASPIQWTWTPGVGDGQGGLVCCASWGCNESDTTERLNWRVISHIYACYYSKKEFFMEIVNLDGNTYYK